MASDSEPRKFFSEARSRPPEVTFRAAKSISIGAYNDMLQSWIDG